MEIFIERKKENVEIEFAGKSKDLMKKLCIVSEEVIVVKNGEVVSEDEILENNDKIEFLSVVSGG